MNANLWDAFAPADMLNSTNLFGNANIGNLALTNMVIAGQIASDQTLVILNWYARSNVAEVGQSPALTAAWHAWKHATIVTLVVGTRPVMQRPLSDLMGPRDMNGGIGGHDQIDDGPNRRELMAMAMYKAYRDTQGPAATGPFPEGLQSNPHGWETWDDLTKVQREGWLAAVASVRPLYQPFIVPVRQNFGVRVDCDRSALMALREVLPTNIAPQALVWVHIDGLETRDVA